jgi:hypothetical protein
MSCARAGTAVILRLQPEDRDDGPTLLSHRHTHRAPLPTKERAS